MRHLVRSLIRSLLLVPAFFAGCSSGAAGTGTGADAAPPAGSVLVVVDTATGSDALARFQVEAAVLEQADGATTPNLLANPHQVRFADPTGSPDGLVLQNAPAGDYAALRLFLVPDSGSVVGADGSVLPLVGTIDLRVPIGDGLRHSASASSWLVVGHDGVAPPPGGGATWAPQLSARSDLAPVTFDQLDIAVVEAAALVARSNLHQQAPLRVTFAADCTFSADDTTSVPDRAAFLGGLGDDRVDLRGELRRDGTLEARHAHRSGRNDNPRLIGRITALEPATDSFVMAVQAQNQRGGPLLDPLPTSIRVATANARLERPNGQPIAFADLQVQHLVKVKWTSRSEPAGELPRFVASEVEVTGSAAGMQPEWQGRVDAVDTVLRTITVVPRNDDPIYVQGVSVASVTLAIADGTTLTRRARQGNSVTAITLDDIVPGQDRIWWRGTVTGPDTIDANWVRVREE